MDTQITGTTVDVAAPPVGVLERRADSREPAFVELWMIDREDATVLRCRCLDRSATGMRLRLALGYGVHEGQRYELSSHPPGMHHAPGLGLMVSRGATVRWTKIAVGGGKDHLDVGVQLDPEEAVLTGPIDLPTA